MNYQQIYNKKIAEQQKHLKDEKIYELLTASFTGELKLEKNIFAFKPTKSFCNENSNAAYFTTYTSLGMDFDKLHPEYKTKFIKEYEKKVFANFVDKKEVKEYLNREDGEHYFAEGFEEMLSIANGMPKEVKSEMYNNFTKNFEMLLDNKYISKEDPEIQSLANAIAATNKHEQKCFTQELI